MILDVDSTQKELEAMEEVGRLRSRSLGRAFFVSWMLIIPPLCLVTGERDLIE